MKKLKRIVVGLDVFEKSNDVLKRALALANEHKANLLIVHAVRTPWLAVPSYFGSKEIGIDKEGITKQIEKKLKTLNKDTKVSCFIFVKEGNAADILLYESKLNQADMIVIGRHSRTKGRNKKGGIASRQKTSQNGH